MTILRRRTSYIASKVIIPEFINYRYRDGEFQATLNCINHTLLFFNPKYITFYPYITFLSKIYDFLSKKSSFTNFIATSHSP